jgi:hypothetical protein
MGIGDESVAAYFISAKRVLINQQNIHTILCKGTCGSTTGRPCANDKSFTFQIEFLAYELSE